MNTIAINSIILAERATALKSAGSSISSPGLDPLDNETTINVNQNAQAAHDDAGQGHGLFINALVASAAQIKEIGEEFFAVDRHGADGFIGMHTAT